MEKTAKLVGTVALGVVLAGLFMNYTRKSIPIVASAHAGFDSGIV